MELLKDCGFERGFILTGVASNVPNPYIGEYLFGKTEGPEWKLGQWASRDLITPQTHCERTGNASQLRTSTKLVRVVPGGEFRMDVLASREYERPRREGEAWPHLLVDQCLTDRDVDLSSLKYLRFRLNFCIDECVNRMSPEDFDPVLHTAQFQWYCTLQNLNKTSPDYGDCIWFGLQFYDARMERPGGTIQVDGGKEDASGFAIFCVDYDKFMPEPVRFGKTYSVDFDLLPEICRAIIEVKGFEGVKSFRHTELSDLRMTSMNLGWELPGTYDVRSSFSGLSLNYEEKE